MPTDRPVVPFDLFGVLACHQRPGAMGEMAALRPLHRHRGVRRRAWPDPARGHRHRPRADPAGRTGLVVVMVLAARLRNEAYEGMVELIGRAKAAGRLREDFDPSDLVLLHMANAGVVNATGRQLPTPGDVSSPC